MLVCVGGTAMYGEEGECVYQQQCPLGVGCLFAGRNVSIAAAADNACRKHQTFEQLFLIAICFLLRCTIVYVSFPTLT